jgi:phosphoserine aminotransferase
MVLEVLVKIKWSHDKGGTSWQELRAEQTAHLLSQKTEKRGYGQWDPTIPFKGLLPIT